MFGHRSELPPAVEAMLVSGVPAKGSEDYARLHAELSDHVARGKYVCQIIQRDLDAGDIGSALEVVRCSIRGQRARMEKINAIVSGPVSPRLRAMALAANWAPTAAIFTVAAIAIIDLLDVSHGEHHALWSVPAVGLVFRPIVERLLP